MSRVLCPDGPDAGATWHLGSPLAEQAALVAGRCFAVLNKKVFTLTGEPRLDWLNSLTTQRINAETAEAGLDALVLSPTGQIRWQFSLVDDGEKSYCWADPTGFAGLVDYLESMKFWTPVELTPREDLTVLWWGSELGSLDSEFSELDLLGTRPSPLGAGAELIIAGWDAESSAKSASEAGVWALEAVRIEAGIPRIGVDSDDRTIPNELGLYATALNKGCYCGQETVARVQNLGRPPRRLVRLICDGELPATGEPIYALDAQGKEKQVGVIGSSAQHYELGPIALALIKRSTPTDIDLRIGGSCVAAAQEVLVDPEIGEHFRASLGERPHFG